MMYSHSAHGPHLILSIEGNLHNQDHYIGMETTVNQHLKEHPGNLIINCQALNHINSSGLNMLLKLLNSYKTNNRQVIIAAANDSVRGVLAITKLNTIFGQAENVQAALSINNRQTTPNS